VLPAIYLRTSLRWEDIETMPRAELDAVIERVLTAEMAGEMEAARG
jgi:hypothetical protein